MECKVKYLNGLGETEVLGVTVFKAAYDNTAWSRHNVDEVTDYGRIFKNDTEALSHLAEVCDRRNYTFEAYDGWGNLVG